MTDFLPVKKRRSSRLLTASFFLSIVSLIAPTSFALTQPRTGYTKAVLIPGFDAATALAVSRGAIVLDQNPDARLLYVPTGSMSATKTTLAASGYTLEPHDEWDIILGPDEVQLDVRLGVSPTVSRELVSSEPPPGQNALWIAQFIRPDYAQDQRKVLEAAGGDVQFTRSNNAWVVAGTAAMAATLRNRQDLQWVSPYHGFLKDCGAIDTGQWRYDVTASVVRAPGFENTIQAINTLGETPRKSSEAAPFARVSLDGFRMILAMPLVLEACRSGSFNGADRLRLYGVWPRRVAPGGRVWISGQSAFAVGTTVTVNGIETTLYRSAGDLRYFFVPPSLQPGSADLLFIQLDGATERQRAAITIDSTARERPPAGGDLFFLEEYIVPLIVLQPNPTYRLHWHAGAAPFDKRIDFSGHGGFLLAVDSDGSLMQDGLRLNAILEQQERLPPPTSIVSFQPRGNMNYAFDRSGNTYSAVGLSLAKTSPSGAVLASWQLPSTDPTDQVDSIDLGADQCTLYYDLLKAREARKFDLCLSTPMVGSFPGGETMFRVLPNGDVLSDYGYRFDASGTFLRHYQLYGQIIGLDPDGTSFWTGEFLSNEPDNPHSNLAVARYSLITGERTAGPVRLSSHYSRGTIYGEWRAATGRPTYSKVAYFDSMDPAQPQPGQRVTVRGAGFVDGIAASWGGIAAPATYISATEFSFVVPVASVPRTLVITNPGQASFAVAPAALGPSDAPVLNMLGAATLAILLGLAALLSLRHHQ